MQISIRGAGLVAEHLKRRLGEIDRQGVGRLQLADGTSVAALLDQLALPADRAYLVSVNDTLVPDAARRDHALRDSDVVMVMPPLKGG